MVTVGVVFYHTLLSILDIYFAYIERTKDVFLAGIRAKSEYKDAKPVRKREIAFELLSNAILQNKEMAQTQLKSPYDLLARTPKDSDFSTLCTLWDEVGTVLEEM